MRIATAGIVSLLACGSNVLAQDTPLVGQVITLDRGAPVIGATIAVDGFDTRSTSDDRGCFTLALPSTGTWTLRVERDGFVPSLVDAPSPGAAASGGPASTTEACGGRATLLIELRPSFLRAEEHVVVTPGRVGEDARETMRAVSVVDRERLAATAPRSTPEALWDAAGVFLQKTNHGSGAPYIRGLIGNQVLVLVDGIRLNNATYRFGPNQYAATIDPFLLDRVEVVRGPGSVMFGSDAIGGVVNLVTRQPELSTDGLRASFAFTGKAVTSRMEETGRFSAAVSGRRAAIRTGITLQQFGDLVAGGSRGTLEPSGYGHGAVDAQAVVQLTPRQRLSASYQFDRADSVPRWDQIAQRGFARYSFAPQERQFAHVRWKTLTGGQRLRAWSAALSYQHTRERRDIRRSGSAVTTLEEDTVDSVGLTTEASGALMPSLTWVAGAEYYHDAVGSWRRTSNAATGSAVQGRGLYPDGATADTGAAFARLSLARPRWSVAGGSRLTTFRVEASDQTFDQVGVDKTSIVSEGGATVQVAPGVQLVANLAQSFRAPNIDDLSTLGRFDFGIEVPAPTLAPERGLTLEGGVRLSSSVASARVVAYRTSLRDLIDRVRTTYEGSAVFDGQAVYAKANVGDAFVRGVEMEAEWRIPAPWAPRFEAHATYTYGQNTTRDEPMRRIPPLNAFARASWQRARWWVDGTVRAATKQSRLAAGDRDDHRIPAGGTPGWWTLDLSAGRPLGERATVTGGLINLFDKLYRTHGSGVDGAGRSAWVAVTVAAGARP